MGLFKPPYGKRFERLVRFLLSLMAIARRVPQVRGWPARSCSRPRAPCVATRLSGGGTGSAPLRALMRGGPRSAGGDRRRRSWRARGATGTSLAARDRQRRSRGRRAAAASAGRSAAALRAARVRGRAAAGVAGVERAVAGGRGRGGRGVPRTLALQPLRRCCSRAITRCTTSSSPRGTRVPTLAGDRLSRAARRVGLIRDPDPRRARGGLEGHRRGRRSSATSHSTRTSRSSAPARAGASPPRS